MKMSGWLSITMDPNWDPDGTITSGNIFFTFEDFSMDSQQGDVQRIAKQMEKLGLNQFNWELEISGTIEHPKVEDFTLENFKNHHRPSNSTN